MNQPVYRPDILFGASERLPHLTPDLIRRLEDALRYVGAFGEVRLVVVKGRVRFIETMRSESLGRCAEEQDFAE
jgi:hypothetical protein